jgi:superfamily I DNA and/or RNA helicase/very-short-patch-repair endonuclease
LHVRFKELFDKLKKLNPEILDEWIAYIQIKKNNSEVENKIIDSFEEKDMEFKDLKQIFFALYYNFLIKKAYELYPNLSNYSGEKLSDLREEFKNLDKTISIRKREDLIQKLNSKKITSGVSYGSTKQLTELGLISRIISQKRPQITLRNLIKKSSLALSQLKPCFMMSPVALAELVRPAEDLFDILIIDEASQMKMEDAIGGLARSKQCVIVGDQQQLAPTDFFDIAADESSDDEDDLIEESILDLAVSRFKPKRMLRWHYRSRNQNLINFSNKFFYDDRLIIPPSPTLKPAIHYNFVKSLYKGRINEQEKDAIAEGLIKFMKSNIRKNENDKSAKSCLVVTMNQEQKELIEDEIRLRENENEIISEYRNSWEGTLEPFEVKNLESVQGDERDCIFISTLFGPNEKGKVLQQFGPINNNTKGHRRLNVLFTRAKKEIYLYTSLQPNDILSENAPQGRVVFKNYIEYAKTGRLEIGDVSEGKEPMSEFEIFVKDGIEKLGYQVDTQVGVSGFYIDLGIKHKKFPDGYILGVECDGRAYHSSKSARDNDILRQSVLEDLGWKIYRIWSTDWFNNPQKELSKLDRYIQKII